MSRGFLIIVCLLGCLIAQPVLHAETMDDILGSRSLQQLDRANQRKLKTVNRSLAADKSYFAQVMLPHGAKLLMEWLGAAPDRFFREAFLPKNLEDMAKVNAIYYDQVSLRRVNLTVQVAKPIKRTAIELGIWPEFAKFEPPALKVIEGQTKELEISGFPAKFFYHLETTGCSLFIKLPKQSLINLETDNCKDKDKDLQELVELAKAFDIKRMVTKIQN